MEGQSAGESALLIEGPRRVGKSTITKLFAQREYRPHIVIDFAKASTEEKNLFNDLSDIDYFFTGLKLLKGVSLYERESVIIFDEVQQYPIARQAIRRDYNEPYLYGRTAIKSHLCFNKKM